MKEEVIMKNILSLILLSIVFCAASGQEQAQMPKKTSLFFRYGKILSAEACSSKPEIKEPTLIMARSRNSVYVESPWKSWPVAVTIPCYTAR